MRTASVTSAKIPADSGRNGGARSIAGRCRGAGLLGGAHGFGDGALQAVDEAEQIGAASRLSAEQGAHALHGVLDLPGEVELGQELFAPGGKRRARLRSGFRQGFVDLGKLGFGGGDAFRGTRSGTLHRRTSRGRCAACRRGGTHHGRGGAREVESELEGASGGALGAVGGEEVSGRLRGLLNRGDVAIPRRWCERGDPQFHRYSGTLVDPLQKRGKARRTPRLGASHPQRTIVTWRRVGECSHDTNP